MLFLKLFQAFRWSIGVFLFFGLWLYLLYGWVFRGDRFEGWYDVLCLLGLPVLGLFFLVVTVGILIQAFGVEPKAEEGSAGGLVLLNDVTIDGKPGQKAIVFRSLGDMLKMAEEVERAEKGPNRPLLYMFQHVALRKAAFENHPELVRELSEPPRSVLPLLHFRSKALFLCERSGLLPADYDLDDAAAEAERAMFDAVKVNPVCRSGFTAHIVTMPVPEFRTESYFVAIVYKDGEPHEYTRESPSTRYFTLEKADNTDRPLLCEWRRDGSRENYGEGPTPELTAFTDAVFERVLAK